jgi:hypothetical protein
MTHGEAKVKTKIPPKLDSVVDIEGEDKMANDSERSIF